MILINSSPKDALKIFQPFLPIAVPVGIGILAAAAEQQGVQTECLDEQVEDRMLVKIAELVTTMEKPYIFGFSEGSILIQRSFSEGSILRPFPMRSWLIPISML